MIQMHMRDMCVSQRTGCVDGYATQIKINRIGAVNIYLGLGELLLGDFTVATFVLHANV